MIDIVKRIVAYDRDDFRKWLRRNYKRDRRVEVILYKKHTGKEAPSHRELMEEAIWFGWIDTTIRRLDDDRYVRSFVKRNKNSKWSENTLRYAKELSEKDRMSKFGMKMYEEGMSKPTHDSGIPKNPEMPDDLRKALIKDKKVWDNFEKFPPSAKKMLYLWVISAKRDETKKKRIEKIVDSSRKGSRVG